MNGDSNQPGSGGESSGNQENAQGQGYATLQQVTELVEQSLRRSQSMKDKSESAVTKLVLERTEAIEKAIRELRDHGQAVPESVEKQLRDEAYADTVRNHVRDGSQDAELAAYLQRGSSEIFRQYGVEVNPNDPADAEYVQMVDAESATSPKMFLDQLEAAARAKAAKLGGRKMSEPQQNKPTGTGMGGGIPSLGGGANTSPKAAPNLEAQYKQELAEAIKNPMYNREQGARIRKKYRDQGLNI